MLTEYRREYTEFNESITREHYLHYSGQKTEYDLERIYDRFSDLFTRQAIADLQKEHDRISAEFGSDKRALAHLLSFAKENYLEAQTKQLTAEIAEYEASSFIDWDGQKVGFHQAAVLLRNEADVARRRQIYDRRSRVIAESNDLRAERLEKIYASAIELGSENYIEMCQQLYGVEYKSLNEQWQAFLNATEKIYTVRIREELLRELKIPLEQAHRADVGRLSRLNRFDQYFPKDRLMRMYRDTLSGLGIDIDKQKNIKIDSVERPQKNPRAFCAPVEVPAEVMLVILPSGGQSDYQTFLHEAGHAQHFGFTSFDLLSEFRYSGDRALSETYAFLLQYLTTDSEWLRAVVGMKEPEEFVRVMLLDKLVLLRRYAAKLDYELKLHSSGDLSSSAKQYVDTLSEATLFRYEPEEFLSDVDDGFYSADYLRAWAFEVMLREYLRTKYGTTWWQNKRAGDLLKEMWNTGNRYPADELIDQVGAGKFTTEPVIDEFIQGLR